MTNATAHDAPRLQEKGLPNVIFELTEQAQDGIGKINDFIIRPVAASEAFRSYNWLAGAPVLNSVGNLSGMVVSKAMRTVYVVSQSAGEYLSLASMVFEVSREMSRMQNVWKSDMDINEKGPLLLMLGSAAILRSVTSVVPTTIHLAAKSLEGYCYAASLASGSAKPLLLANALDRGDVELNRIYQQQWDGENWYHVIVTAVNR